MRVHGKPPQEDLSALHATCLALTRDMPSIPFKDGIKAIQRSGKVWCGFLHGSGGTAFWGLLAIRITGCFHPSAHPVIKTGKTHPKSRTAFLSCPQGIVTNWKMFL